LQGKEIQKGHHNFQKAPQNWSVVQGILQLFGKKRNGGKLVEHGVRRLRRPALRKTDLLPHIPKRPKGEKGPNFSMSIEILYSLEKLGQEHPSCIIHYPNLLS